MVGRADRFRLLLAVPFMLGAIYGAFPDFKGFINGFIKVGIVYIQVHFPNMLSSDAPT